MLSLLAYIFQTYFFNTLTIFFSNYLRMTKPDYPKKHITHRNTIRSGKFPNFVKWSSSYIDWKQMTLCSVVDLDVMKFYTSLESTELSCNTQIFINMCTETNRCSCMTNRKWLILCQMICTGLTFDNMKHEAILVPYYTIIIEY